MRVSPDIEHFLLGRRLSVLLPLVAMENVGSRKKDNYVGTSSQAFANIGHLEKSSGVWKWRILKICLCVSHTKPSISMCMSCLEEASRKSFSLACVRRESIEGRKEEEKENLKKHEEE